jgi:hypothetical protein
MSYSLSKCQGGVEKSSIFSWVLSYMYIFYKLLAIRNSTKLTCRFWFVAVGQAQLCGEEALIAKHDNGGGFLAV